MKVQTVRVSLPEQKIERKKRRKLKRKVKAFLAFTIAAFLGLICFNISFAEEPKPSATITEPEVENPVFEQFEVISSNESETLTFVYNSDIPMPLEHQQFLFEKCVERGLDYKRALAVIKHESNFNQNAIGFTEDYGYFQVNEINRETMSQTLDTPDSPLNPYINIEWGTFILSDLYAYWEAQGMTGQELDHSVWSSYNKGITGFKKYGPAQNYINKVELALAEL